MNAGELDRQFAAHVAERNVPAARLACILVAGLMPAGIVLDVVTQPGHVSSFFLLRVLASACSLLVLALTYTEWGARSAFWLGAAPGITAAAAISIMTEELDGYASPYYAGVALCILGIGLAFLWTAKEASLVCTVIVGIWLAPTIVRGEPVDAGPFFNNLYFLVLTAVIAVASNASRHRLAKREFAAQAKLSDATTELRRAHTKLQELDQFKSEFFANITHELKTPLTMILASLELMLHGEMGAFAESQRSSLQSMFRSGAKLMKLINDLLDLSKLDECRLRLQIAEHDLVAYLRSLVGQVHSLAQRKSIQLTFDADVNACRVFCDLERLERVFVNLLSNAAKFTPPMGAITMRLRDTGESIEVAVSDNGIGFPPEMAGQIFERFVQVDMAGTRKFGGTGIGLSLASELIHLHGGTIKAESGGAGGATFTVQLRKGREHFAPDTIDRRVRREDRADGNRESDHGIGEWQVASHKQFRFIDIDEATDQRIVVRDANEQEHERSVLVVEDTPDVIRVIHLALRSHFRILAATGGVKGLELASKHSPDLIITDLMMPDMDGMELTRLLRADQKTRHIPILMLTARGDVEDRAAGMEAGVNAYLIKPFSTKELVSTIRGLMRIQETSADLVLARSMDSLQTIAGGLAHEINNPLNYMKNALALIQADSDHLLSLVKPEGESEGAAPRTNDAIDRMSRMFRVADTGLRRIGETVELMQRYSREGFTRILQPFDVVNATRDVIALLQTGMKESIIETSIEGGGEIMCVPEEFNQVLTNLVQNALDALPDDRAGRVNVRIWNEDAALLLSVKDNGCGITAEQRTKIFTPFYTTKEVGKGMGLGLSIVWRVVTSIGGTVQVTSQPGEGTEFKLRLPAISVPERNAQQRGVLVRVPTTVSS